MTSKEEKEAKKKQAKEDKATVKKGLQNARRGYTPLKGAKDTRISKHATVYTNTSLWTVTREGESNVELSSNSTRVIKAPTSYKEAIKKKEAEAKQKEAEAGKDIKKKTLGLVSGGSIITNQDLILASQRGETYTSVLAAAIGGQESSQMSFMDIVTDFTQPCTDEVKSGFTNNSIGVKLRIREPQEVDLLSEISECSEFPFGAITGEQDDASNGDSKASEESNKKKTGKEKAKAMAKAVKNATRAASAVVEDTAKGVAKWFDEQEAIIDALPTMSDFGNEVYVVEFREDYEVTSADGKKEKVSDWFYTGETTVMDRQANQRIQEAKAKVCAYLSDMQLNITLRINKMLEEKLKKVKQCEIFIKIINMIKKLPSLTTIISWAKSIIDSFIETYKMIYGMFMSVMEVIELVIIRGPQLINKLISKITEFNCPISLKVKVNVEKKETKKST